MNKASSTTEWDQFGSEYDFPRFIGQPRMFIVATTPRCGSHYLCHHLRKTGLLGCPLEYFSEARFRDWCLKLNTDDPQRVLNYLFAYRSSPNGIFGVKAHWPQLEWFQQEKIQFYDGARTPYIRIIRRDRIAQAVSWNIAQQTNSWISFRQIEHQPVYDYHQVLAAYQSIEYEARQWTHYLLANGNPVLELTYEEFRDDIKDAVTLVAEFLNVDLRSTQDSGFNRLPQRQSMQWNEEWCERFRFDLKRFGG